MSSRRKTNTDLDCIFKPRSIAVIGASRSRGTIGREILHNLMEYEFNGTLFPVNPNAKVVNSIKCYPTILDVPDDVDLAIVVVPVKQVIAVVKDCAKKGVKGLVIISAGFKESGPQGAVEEKKLVALLKKHGMRAVGPNCMGVVNTDPEFNMERHVCGHHPDPGKDRVHVAERRAG